MTTKFTAGRAVTAIGVIHSLFAPLFFAPQFRAMVDDGVVASLGRHYDRNTAFWFVWFGFVLMIVGEAMHVIERELTARVPERFGWFLFAVALGGVVLMPDSGFWLAFVPAGMVLFRARAAAPASA